MNDKNKLNTTYTLFSCCSFYSLPFSEKWVRSSVGPSIRRCPSLINPFQVSRYPVDELLVLKFIHYLRNLLVGGHENSYIN